VTLEVVRELASKLPATEEGVCHGTPAVRVKGKFFLRLKEDAEDHYHGYPAILFRLSKINTDQLADLLELGWRFVAPQRLVASFDSAQI
jgi:hypothetical protein